MCKSIAYQRSNSLLQILLRFLHVEVYFANRYKITIWKGGLGGEGEMEEREKRKLFSTEERRMYIKGLSLIITGLCSSP